jgi:hypothetical protein
VCTSPASTPCQNGTRDGSETDTDCGGATCNNLGLFCAVGKLCSVDADCGAPNNASICVTGTCRKTFNLSGTVSTSVPVTLQLTPGGTLSATSASPRQLAVTPASTTFAFLNTRVSGAYAISEVAQAGVACQFTNGSGTATADVSNIAISCTSCSNGTKEGTETDVDCGGACADQALRCAGGKICLVNNDCLSNSCNAISHTCASVTTGTWSSVGQTFGSTGLAYTEGSATSATDAWAAGGEDVANYDGATWTVIAKPFAGFPVESLFATSIGGAPHVWAGSNTSLLSEWDGTTWTARPVMMLATNETFLAIHGDAAGQIAVGTNGTIARTNVSGDFAYEFFMFPPPTSATLNAVYKVDDNTAWAVGDGGTIVMQGGPMWSAQTSNTTANLRAVWAISSTDAWAAGDGGVVLHWDGNTWSTVASGTTSNIFALFGDATNSVWLAGAGGVIRLWNGSAWVSETSNTTQNLSAVFGAVGMRWAVGANQTFVSRN